MEIKTLDSRMFSLVILYDMQSQFFKNVIDGISDEDAHNRLNTKANHIAWLTGSLVQERFEMAGMLGNPMVPSANELFKDHQGIKDNVDYPPLEDFKKDWETITPVLRNELMTATEEKLNEKQEMMPGETYSNFEMLTFLIYREANCIGQIALWRRLLGYPPMKYM
jgi:hypothetical protein